MMKLVLPFFLLCGLSLSVQAAELTRTAVARYGELRILRVDYLGAFRTARSELALLTSLRRGEKLSEVDPDAVVQRLERTGLYSEVSLGYELKEGGVVIQVELREKWTLIPLPFAAYSGQALTLGLIFMDSDFLGSMSTLATGGFWTVDGWAANLAYFKRRIGGSDVDASFFAVGGRGERKAAYADGSLYESYARDFAGGGITANFLAGRELRPFVGTRFAWSRPEASYAARQGWPPESAYLAPELGLSYDGRRVEGWFKPGLDAKAKLKQGIPLEGGSTYLFGGLDAGILVKVLGGAALSFGASAGYGDEPSSQSERLGGPGYRTLPFGETFSTRYGAAHADFEFPVARSAWGLLTLTAFYEAGVYETGPDGGERAELFHGPGGGLRFYLRHIAFPALGADFAYDVPRGQIEFSASLGFSM
ncbi:MAG TPA: hypothetical protein VMV90_11465 [Rectinemataceae bacterium]|nr:hypothetical protein [Rectinemataceae bacterium]